jgi:hypothetical protein
LIEGKLEVKGACGPCFLGLINEILVRLTKPLLISVLLWLGTSGSETKADVIEPIWPVCREPEAVEKARRAGAREKWEEFRPLGCTFAPVVRLRTRVIRCAENLTDEILTAFSGNVRRDASLPKSVCEVEIFFEDGASVTAYTYFSNIKPSP